ncbi:hypothetical protein ACLOJK_023771 [Asimina triloba]
MISAVGVSVSDLRTSLGCCSDQTKTLAVCFAFTSGAVIARILCMDAAVVGSIVSLAIDKIAWTSWEVESIQQDLRWMQSFLRDADGRLGEGDQLVKTLVRDVWGIACRVEDAIETFTLREERRRRRRGGPIQKCIYALSDFCVSQTDWRDEPRYKERNWRHLWSQDDLWHPRNQWGRRAQLSEQKIARLSACSSALRDGEHVVGFEKDVDALVERLIRGAGEVVRVSVGEELKAAFPDASNGSRIILTTRNERVALYADSDPANPPYPTRLF